MIVLEKPIYKFYKTLRNVVVDYSKTTSVINRFEFPAQYMCIQRQNSNWWQNIELVKNPIFLLVKWQYYLTNQMPRNDVCR